MPDQLSHVSIVSDLASFVAFLNYLLYYKTASRECFAHMHVYVFSCIIWFYKGEALFHIQLRLLKWPDLNLWDLQIWKLCGACSRAVARVRQGGQMPPPPPSNHLNFESSYGPACSIARVRVFFCHIACVTVTRDQLMITWALGTAQWLGHWNNFFSFCLFISKSNDYGHVFGSFKNLL